MRKRTVLSIQSLKTDYGDGKDILKEVSLDIAEGEFFGLAGLNGVGKTTLIKSILHLHWPKAGHILINDMPHSDDHARAKIAYCPERFEPPWFLNGMEFINFSLTLYKHSLAKEKIKTAAEKIGLNPDVLDQKVSSYSKGMRQKLGLLATMNAPADIFILDEPMSGLDPLARAQVKEVLLDKKTENKTVIMCSHILADMDEICDRMGVLHDGQLQFLGKPSALKKEMKEEYLERAFLKKIAA